MADPKKTDDMQFVFSRPLLPVPDSYNLRAKKDWLRRCSASPLGIFKPEICDIERAAIRFLKEEIEP